MTGVFEVSGRGTVIAVEIQHGTIRAGDSIAVSTPNGPRVVTVRSVEFVDREIGKPTFRADVGLVVREVPAAEVIVGSDVRAVPTGG